MELEEKERVQIKTSEVIAMLEDGETKEEIGKHYGLIPAHTKLLFQHSTLKDKRTKKAPAFEVIDDLMENESIQQDIGDNQASQEFSNENTIEQTLD